MSTWQLNETAPRDGSKVLLYLTAESSRDSRIVTCRIVTARWEGLSTAGGYWISDGYHSYVPEEDVMYWQPLPAPPQDISEYARLEKAIQVLADKLSYLTAREENREKQENLQNQQSVQTLEMMRNLSQKGV